MKRAKIRDCTYTIVLDVTKIQTQYPSSFTLDQSIKIQVKDENLDDILQRKQLGSVN